MLNNPIEFYADLQNSMIALLSEALRANISSRLIHSPQQTTKPLQLTGAQAYEALDGWVYKEKGMVTLDDCRIMLNRVTEHFSIDESVILLQRFGVQKLNDLWLGAYQSLVAFGSATLEYNLPPSASWTNDNTPTYSPRWLIYHDTSEALFEVSVYSDYVAAMDEGNCSDVTGIDKFELQFKEANKL